jgi:hypothetical protein
MESSARLWEQLREHFEVPFRAEKYGVPYFLAESEAQQSDPRKEAAGAGAPRETVLGQVRVQFIWPVRLNISGSLDPNFRFLFRLRTPLGRGV